LNVNLCFPVFLSLLFPSCYLRLALQPLAALWFTLAFFCVKFAQSFSHCNVYIYLATFLFSFTVKVFNKYVCSSYPNVSQTFNSSVATSSCFN
jgi:hypothetical protein